VIAMIFLLALVGATLVAAVLPARFGPRSTRRATRLGMATAMVFAGLALAAYLVAVFPSNVYVAIAGVDVDGQPGGWYPWLRLPLQVLFVAWALWSSGWHRRQLRSVRSILESTHRSTPALAVAGRVHQ
jgi:hypothetical protein